MRKQKISFMLMLFSFCLSIASFAFIYPVQYELNNIEKGKMQNEIDDEEGDEQICDHVQMVIMIDQSPSMLKNDPTGLRFDAPRNIVDILGNNYLNARRSGGTNLKPYKIDISVLQFGLSVVPEYSIISKRIAPVDEEAWEEQFNELKDLIAPEELKNLNKRSQIQNSNLNGTGFVDVFREAEKIVNDNIEQVDGCPIRVVMLLTDGNPDRGVGEELRDEVRVAHMAEVENIVKRSFQGDGNYVYVTGINVLNDGYWEITDDDWERITSDNDDLVPRRAVKVALQPEIGDRMANIVHYLLDDGTISIEPGSLVVPPYLQSMRLTFYPPDPSDFMVLADPNGLEITKDRDDIEVEFSGENTAVQVIEINHPDPGIYELATSVKRDDVLITFQPIFVQMELVEPEVPMQQFTSGTIKLRLIDSNGNPIPAYQEDKYKLILNAEVASYNASIPLSFARKEEGIYEANFTPIANGTHKLNISGIAYDDAGNEQMILDGEAGTFYVDPVTLVEGTAIDKAGCAPCQYQSFNVPFELVNESTGDIAVFAVSPSWEIEAVYPDGTVKDDLVMSKNPDKEGEYILELETDQPGDIKLSVSASAPNPVDGTLIVFYQNDFQISVADGSLVQVDVKKVSPTASKLERIIAAYFPPFIKTPEGTGALIGKRFLFFNNKIELQAQMQDLETGKSLSESSYLPEIKFIPLKGTNEEIVFDSWSHKGNGLFTASDQANKIGAYRVDVIDPESQCDVGVETDIAFSDVNLVYDLWSYLVALLLLLLGVAIIFLIIRWVLFNFVNPLKGFVGIIGSGEKLLWYQGLGGKSCWTFRKLKPSETAYVTKIKFVSWNQKKNEVKVKIWVQDPVKRKNNKRVFVRSIDHWRNIDIGTGSRMIWRSSVVEIRKFK